MGRLRPSLWHCLWGAPFLLVGGGFSAYTMLHGIMHVTDSLTQVVVPGQAELSLKAGQTYTIFLEEQTTVDGKIYSTTGSVEGLACGVASPETGVSVETRKPGTSASYDVNGRSGHSVLEFTVPRDGKYSFTCDYGKNAEAPRVVLAVGSGVGESISRTVLGGLAEAFGGAGACVAVVLVVLRMRERGKRVGQSGQMRV